MAGYEAGTQELRQAGKEMEDSNVQLMDRMKALAAAVDAVQWKGQAHTAFVQLMGAFQSDAQRLNDSLVRMAEEISASATEYDRQEQQAQESLSGITSALEGL